jgi:hypothetical protein
LLYIVVERVIQKSLCLNKHKYEFCIYVYIMSLFLHKENQNILWNLLHKSPYFIEFQQKYPNQKNEFFSQAMEAISGEMYFNPSNVHQLTEINKEALTKMSNKLKEILGYSAAWSQHSISDETDRKNMAKANSYTHYEEQYHELLKPPKAPSLDLNLGIKDEKIGEDIEELIKRQTEMREREIYIPPPAQIMKNNPVEIIPRELQAISSKSSPHDLPDVLRSVSTKTTNASAPASTIKKLKIMDEEEPIALDGEFDTQYKYVPMSAATPDGFDIRQELMETQVATHHHYATPHVPASITSYQTYDVEEKIHTAIGGVGTTTSVKQVHWSDREMG